MKREIRDLANAITADTDQKGFWADVVTFGPVDSYGTRWAPEVFDDSLGEHMPVLAWGHDWSEPIGRADDMRKDDTRQALHFRLDAVPEVPRGLQAHYQLRSGTLTDVSVGILRRSDNQNDDGTVTITKADLDEVSVVLRGAVPGAQVLAGSVRSRTVIDLGAIREKRRVPLDDVLELARRVQKGEIPREDAEVALDLMAHTPSPADGEGDPNHSSETDNPGGTVDPEPEVEGPDSELAAVEAEADQALTGRSRR